MKFIVGHSGIEILSRLDREKPDLILIDYDMEDYSGPELCSDIRENVDLRSVPILIAIPYAANYLEEECRRAGADGCLVKPLNIDELLSKMSIYLNLKLRQHPRSTVIFEIKGRNKDKDLFFGKTFNISEGGLGLETEQFILLGDRIHLNFILPGTDEIIAGAGKVVWSYEDKFADVFRYGVQFENLDARCCEAIRRFQESIIPEEVLL
jgi:CheY-like chemotaxis protein